MTPRKPRPRPVPAGEAAARIRDIPRHCICDWHLNTAEMRYLLIQPRSGCPWHGGN